MVFAYKHEYRKPSGLLPSTAKVTLRHILYQYRVMLVGRILHGKVIFLPQSRFRTKDDQKHSLPVNTDLRRMSSYAHGRSAITVLAPSVTPLFQSASRRYFCSSSFTPFERSGRNLGFYSPRSREIVLRQSDKKIIYEKLSVCRNSCGGRSRSPSLGINHSTPSVSPVGNSERPRAPTIFTLRQRTHDGERQHGGMLFRAIGRRCNSSVNKGREGEGFKDDADSRDGGKSAMATSKTITKTTMANKHIIGRLPNITQIHRPTKEELLAAATGFWARLKVRFKWFSIRSARPFNIDEIGAFFSWILVGHVLWIILGTTTFFSLAIFAVNTVFAQGETSLLISIALYLLHRRDTSSLGRKLPNKIFGDQNCFRVSHSAQMG